MADETNSCVDKSTLYRRVILVPGGSGGLGSALVTLLAREGATLVVGYRSNRQRAEGLASSLEDEFDCNITLVGGELTDPNVRIQYLEASTKNKGAPYGLVCFTGDPGRIEFSSASGQDMLPSLTSNYIGPLLMARDCASAMKSEGVSGAIVFLSSVQAVGLFPGSYNYSGPKAALIHTAKTMAKELGGGSDGIRVNVVAPGVNRAGMALKSIESGKYDCFVEQGIIPRFGRAEDVSRVVRLLLEPDNYLTGQVITVDGGLTLRS
jgi:3-oxoacyl-[acyl-carrier protein] reductase